MLLSDKFWRRAVCVSAAWVSAAICVNAQTQYTADGAMNGIEEEARWYANRARYDPVKEKARLGLGSSVPSGPIAPLAPNAKLITASQYHSYDMATLNKFQHQTPTGSVHYAAGFQFWQRLTNETYSYSIVGENIAAGSGLTSGRGAHEGWFLSESGHRDNLLDARFGEIGLGHHHDAGSDYGNYYTEDLGSVLVPTQHWFTGTIFCDKGNAAYDCDEGVAGIDIYLRTPAGLHGWCDRSSSSGGFAIPISAIPDGTNVEVILENQTGSDTNISIPLNYDTVLRIDLTNGESRVYGSFAQPASALNIGFRDVVPQGPTVAGGGMEAGGFQVTAGTLPGGTYVLQWRENLLSGGWAGAVTSTASGTATSFLDEGGAGRPAPGAATSRFYRVVLLTEE